MLKSQKKRWFYAAALIALMCTGLLRTTQVQASTARVCKNSHSASGQLCVQNARVSGFRHATDSDSAAAWPWATAEVRRIDKTMGKISLKHGEIKNLDMPPMSMVFQVKNPLQLDALQVGQKVRFQATQENGVYWVLQIEAIAL